MRGRIPALISNVSVIRRAIDCAILLLILPCYSGGFSQLQPQSAQPKRSKIPEEVVQQQLNLLQTYDVKEAFAYNSDNNQAVTGPWKSYAASLADEPFRSLLGHVESCVLMTISHNGGDYVCCMVKVVPGNSPLPHELSTIIQHSREASAAPEDELADGDEDDEDENDVGEDFALDNDCRPKLRACELFWCEVSKQFDSDKDEAEGNFYYRVDSLLPDAEDLELDYMETTLFAVGDEDDDEEDDDDWSGYFFELF